MRTNINIDDNLMSRAFAVSECTTKRDIVDMALREYVTRRERKDLRELRGKIRFADDYDYKAMREDKPYGAG